MRLGYSAIRNGDFDQCKIAPFSLRSRNKILMMPADNWSFIHQNYLDFSWGISRILIDTLKEEVN
jgi:hypothetical protein